MRNTTRYLVRLMVLCLSVAPLLVRLANAEDLLPPPWPRLGEANFSTSAEWEFLPDNPNNPIIPDGGTVPLIVGDAKPALDAEFELGSPHPSGLSLGDIFYNGEGWEGSAESDGLSFLVPNWIDEQPLKVMRVQVTWKGENQLSSRVSTRHDGPGVLVKHVDRDLPGDLNYFLDQFELRPSPDSEKFVVDVPDGTVLHSVIIDTISVPEPHSLTLILLAIAGLFTYRLV